MEVGHRTAYIFLATFACFFFLACALNVFIAVLGECYDQQQDKVICTFLQERAKICRNMYLRPSLPLPYMEPTEQYVFLWIVGIVAPTIAITCFILLVWSAVETKSSSWLPAAILAVSLLLFQAVLKSELTRGWNERYLWMCHAADIKEELFLTTGTSPVEGVGRINQIKTFILEQSKLTTAKCKSDLATVREDVVEFRREMTEMRQVVKEVREQMLAQQDTLAYIAEQLGDKQRRPHMNQVSRKKQ